MKKQQWYLIYDKDAWLDYKDDELIAYTDNPCFMKIYYKYRTTKVISDSDISVKVFNNKIDLKKFISCRIGVLCSSFSYVYEADDYDILFDDLSLIRHEYRGKFTLVTDALLELTRREICETEWYTYHIGKVEHIYEKMEKLAIYIRNDNVRNILLNTALKSHFYAMVANLRADYYDHCIYHEEGDEDFNYVRDTFLEQTGIDLVVDNDYDEVGNMIYCGVFDEVSVLVFYGYIEWMGVDGDEK